MIYIYVPSGELFINETSTNDRKCPYTMWRVFLRGGRETRYIHLEQFYNKKLYQFIGFL
jgi:hypothetical protein